MKKKIFRFGYVLIAIAMSFGFFSIHLALADTTTVTASMDTSIRSTTPTTNQGNTLMYYELAGGGSQGSALMRFSLPSISGTINDVQLYLATACNSGTGNMGIYPITRSGWTTSATWLTYDGTNPWSSAGGDIGSLLATQTDVSDHGGSYGSPVDLGAVGTFGTNLDLLGRSISSAGNNACIEGSGASGNTEKIIITYTPSAPPIPPVIPSLGRIATSTCTTSGATTTCFTNYTPEETYYDWLFTNMTIVALLGIMVMGTFFGIVTSNTRKWRP